jgi:hypothetical protein
LSKQNDRTLRWAPSVVLVAVVWIGAVAAAVWCGLLIITGADPAGQLLSAVAALSLLVAAAFSTVARPRLAADTTGITVRGLLGSHRYPWSRVSGVQVLRTRRWGRETALLELEVIERTDAERLLLFGRLELDDDPEDVAEQLLALRGGQPTDTA